MNKLQGNWDLPEIQDQAVVYNALPKTFLNTSGGENPKIWNPPRKTFPETQDETFGHLTNLLTYITPIDSPVSTQKKHKYKQPQEVCSCHPVGKNIALFPSNFCPLPRRLRNWASRKRSVHLPPIHLSQQGKKSLGDRSTTVSIWGGWRHQKRERLVF